jgi:hypothetical protein
MLRFLADENLNGHLIRGLFLRYPAIDLVRVMDVGLSGFSDAEILEWAAGENRILLTHDVRTMPADAYARVKAGLPMPGVIEIPERSSFASLIEELLLIAECGSPGDWDGQVIYLRI